MKGGQYIKILLRDRNLNTILMLSTISSLIFIGAISEGSRGVFAEKFRATMTGNNEVPPVGTTVSGYTAFRTASNDTIIKYKVNITGLFDVTGAQIHQGKKGQNGDIVVDLFNNSKRNKIKVGMAIRGNISDSNLIGSMKGHQLDALISAINNGTTYVNILTPSHPNGEIRGQIESQSGMNMNQSSFHDTNITGNQ